MLAQFSYPEPRKYVESGYYFGEEGGVTGVASICCFHREQTGYTISVGINVPPHKP